MESNIPFVIIQYTFSDGVQVPIKMAPHGNCTKSKQPFFRTQHSTLESMKENIPVMSPKKVLNETYSEAGGLLQMSSSGEVGRNLRQIYNIKSFKGCTSSLTSKCDKDLVYDLLEQHYVSMGNFVRNVNFAEGVMSVIGTDRQFDDILRFCAGENMEYGSVLGIDPTFNLGDFFVTPTVYEHKMIKNKTTGKHPNFIGPTLIHQDRKFATYYYFASEIKKIRPALQGLVSFGTDGEEALSSAFSSVFPRSVHLLCSFHKRDNLTRKLRELKVDEIKMKQILSDIFGSDIGDTHFQGLIDSNDCTHFMQRLELLKPKWESLCPGFVDWFLKHEANLMCTSMVASVRANAGLGNPPKPFTTNSNESLNNLLKRRVNFKRSEWPKFNEILLAFVSDQQGEFEKSIFGQGEYELVDAFKHLEVAHCNWIQMNAEQRKKKIEKACSVKLNFNASLSAALKDTRSNTSFSAGLEGTGSKKGLSVPFFNAKVDHVSLERVKTMWEKAAELIGTEGLILPAAGATNTGRQVASLSSLKTGKAEAPHYVCSVKHAIGTEVKCDCPVYRSSPNICQHALAAAEDLEVLSDYLLWVRRTKKSPNLSQLIASSVPKDGGQKPSARRKGNPKRKISTDTTSVAQAFVSTSCGSNPSVTSVQEPLPLHSSHTVVGPSNPDLTSPGMSSGCFSMPPGMSSGCFSMPPGMSSGCFSMPQVLPQPGIMGAYNDLYLNVHKASNPNYQFYAQRAYDASHPVSFTYPDCHFYSPVTQSIGGIHPVYNISSTDGRPNSSVSPKYFTVQWLTGTQIRMCYGCATPIRTNTTTVPEAPYDIIIRYKERRYYKDQATKSLKLTTKEENTYYHCMKTCILNKHPGFTSSLLYIPPELISTLLPSHKLHIYDNFGICL